MLLAIAYLLLTFAAGWLALSLARIRLSWVETACVSFMAGFALLTPLTFLLSWAFGIGAGAILGLAGALLAVALMWRRLDWRLLLDRTEIVFLAAVLLGVAAVFVHSHLELTKDGFVVAANSHGDLMYHLRVMNSFAYSNNFPPQEPIFAGEPLKYHFFFDFYSAVLLVLGLGFVQAMIVPEIIMAACLFALIFCFASRFCSSRAAGFFAAFIFAFSGGLAYLFAYSPGMGASGLAAGVHGMYISNTLQFVFGNILETLEAQRPLLAGLALFCAVLLLLFAALRAFPEEGRGGKAKKKADALPAVAACGVLTGLCPLIHGYVFIGLAIAGAAAIIVYSGNRLRDLALFLGLAGLVAAPAALFLLQGHGSGYPKLNLYWEADTPADAVVFYLKNFGLSLALIAGGLALSDWKKRFWYAGMCGVFVLANVMQFQWFEFDNYKFIAIWYLAGSFFAAALLAELARRGGTLGAALALALLLAATVDGLAVQEYNWDNRYAVFGLEEKAMADWVIGNTPPKTVFITSTSHTQPIPTLTGRSIVVGPFAWVAPHGLDQGARNDEVLEVYSGADGARAVLGKYGVGYVVVGPYETDSMQVNEQFFEESGLFVKVYDQVLDGKRWRLYKVSGLP